METSSFNIQFLSIPFPSKALKEIVEGFLVRVVGGGAFNLVALCEAGPTNTGINIQLTPHKHLNLL